MKRYEQFNQDPLKLAEYVTDKLEKAIETILVKTGNKFVNNPSERQAVKGIILTELMEEVE